MIVIMPDPFTPEHWQRLNHEFGESIADLLERQTAIDMTRDDAGQWRMALPVIVRTGYGSDDCLLQAEWDVLCSEHETLIVQAHPLDMGGGGGGEKNILGTIAMVAVMAIAPTAGAALAGQMGITSALGTQLLTAGISMVASYALNSLLPAPAAPQLPTPATNGSIPQVDPVYNLQAQGNVARLGGVIPLQYGRLTVSPDLAAEPWSDFVGEDQFLYQLHCLGVGTYDVHDIYIEDTPITSFEEVTTEIVTPGQNVTLFPTNVETSGEVSGQELLGTNEAGHGYVGGFTANTAGTTAYQCAFDLWYPRGIGHWNDDASLASKSISVEFQVRELDSNGDPVGSWVSVGAPTETAAKSTPYGLSHVYSINVPSGRFEARAKRLDARDTDSRDLHQVQWAGLRTYLRETVDTGDVTLLAVRMRRTNNLSARSERRIRVDCTRQVRTWSTGGGWSGLTSTENPAWMLADLFTRRSDYTDTGFLQQLEALASTWTSRGDTCAVRWSGQISVWEAARRIARTGRASVHWEGGYLYAFRHQPQAPTAKFTPRSIRRGSLVSEVRLPTTDEPDSLDVVYFDRGLAAPETMTVTLDGGTEDNAAEWNALEIPDRDQAWREGRYERAMTVYGGEIVTWRTYAKGMLPPRGSVVALSHPLLDYGQSAELVSVSGDHLTLEVDRDLDWDGSAWQISLTKRDGSYDGPYAVTQGSTVRHLVLVAPLSWAGGIDWTDGKRPEVSFGETSDVWEADVTILSKTLKPNRGEDDIEIVGLIERDEFHAADSGIVPPQIPASQLPRIDAPTVEDLTVEVTGSPSAPVLEIGWRTHPDANRYVVQQSADGVTWTTAVATFTPSYRLQIQPGPIHVRVAAEGVQRGAWSTWSNPAPGELLAPPGNVTNLALESAWVGPVLRVAWTAAARVDHYEVEIHHSGGMARQWTVEATTRAEYTWEDALGDGGPWRDLTVKVRGVGADGSFSAADATLAVSNPAPGAPGNISVAGDLTGFLVSYESPGDPDIRGFRIYASASQGFTPAPGNKVYDGKSTVRGIEWQPNQTVYVRVAANDYWGLSDGTLSGEYSVTTGRLGPSHLLVNTLSALSANLGTITAGKLQDSTGQRYIDLDATGNSPFLKVGSAIEIQADGDATFAGTLTGNAVVGTSQLQGGSATAGSGSWTSGGYTLTSSWTTYRTVSLTTVGGFVMIQISAFFPSANECRGLRVLRNGSVIYSTPTLCSNAMGINWAQTITDSPGSGGVVYQLQAIHTAGVTGTISSPALVVIELRR